MPFLPPNQQRQSTEGTWKVLEIAWKQIRCLKVLEKSLNLNLANFEISHLLTILKQALVCISPVSHCSLNFECPRLGYGFLSIILVLEKCNLGPWKVLEICTFGLLRTLDNETVLCSSGHELTLVHAARCRSASARCCHILISWCWCCGPPCLLWQRAIWKHCVSKKSGWRLQTAKISVLEGMCIW